MTNVLPVKIDKGTGQPLVLLHGLGNNYKSWSYVLEHIDYTKWRGIVLDLLGVGDAPKPKIKYTPSAHAEAVVQTLKKLGIQKATFAGHSMGCIVAIEIAAEWPELVDGLVLFGAPLYKTKPRASWWRKITRAEGLYFSVFEIVKNNPDAVQAGGKIADDLVPLVKGMEITEQTWPAYKSSLEHTIMQVETYKKAMKLRTRALYVCGFFDMFIITKNIKSIRKNNRKYTRIKKTLGPHELTPRQGKTCAEILNKF